MWQISVLVDTRSRVLRTTFQLEVRAALPWGVRRIWILWRPLSLVVNAEQCRSGQEEFCPLFLLATSQFSGRSPHPAGGHRIARFSVTASVGPLDAFLAFVRSSSISSSFKIQRISSSF